MLPSLRSSLPRATAVLALVAATCPLLGQSFSNPYRIPTTVDPFSVVAGDINGDGIPDILWGDVSTTPAVLHILLGTAGGGYSPGISVTLPPNSTSECLLTDLNLDHHLDLVCTGRYTTSAYVSVLFGNGDGTFQPATTTLVNNPTTVGGYTFPVVTAVGDLNGDGIPDLYETDAENETAEVLLSDGKGGFKPGITLQEGINDSVPIATDINGDGILDLVFPAGPTVELGKGDGSFGPMINYSALPYYDATCVFHDMDGDGHLDAVCGFPETEGGDLSGGTALIVLHGNPDGSFNTTPIAQKVFGDKSNEYDGFGTFEVPTYVGDVNGDGILDVLGNSGDGLAVVLGGPGLTFNTPLHYAQAVVGEATGLEFSLYQSQFIDINGDGIVDIVAAGPNGIYITYGQKNGTFASAFAPEVTQVIGYSTIADFNGDGIPDIVATGDSAIKLSLGKGDGTFAPPTALPNSNGAVDFSTPLSQMNARILHGDFNGDGKLDLLAVGSPAIYQYNEYILFGHGDGTFDAPVVVPNNSLALPTYAPITDSSVYDINHDGRSDLLSTSTPTTAANPYASTAEIDFELSNGDGTFKKMSTAVPSDIQQGLYAFLTLPALADFNRDGKLDAVYGSVTNAYVVNGHGDGTFDTTATPLPIPTIGGQPSLNTIAVATGDFDGDGNQDFAVLTQYGSGQYPYPSPLATAAWVFYGNGNGTFSAPVLAGTFNRNYSGITTAQLKKTGLPSLVLQTGGSLDGGYSAGIIDAMPSRAFGTEVNFTAGTGLSSIAVADVNMDGLPDLVFGNGDYNVRASSVTVLLNQSPNSGGSTGTTGDSTSTNLTCVPSTVTVDTTSLFTVTVTSASGTPTGTIDFTDNGTALTQLALVNGAVAYTFNARQTGERDIVATYVPTGSFGASSGSCTVTTNGIGTATTLFATPTSAVYGTPINLTATVAITGTLGGRGSASGTVTFYNGTTAISPPEHVGTGVATFTTTTLPPGIDYLTCVFNSTGIFASSDCNIVPVTITQSSAAITLTSSSNPAVALTPITFTAQVAPGSGGTIVFGINGQNYTTIPNAAGTSTYTISTLTAGSYLITATWFATPDALGEQASLTQVVTIPVAAPDFSLTGTDTSFKIAQAGTGNLLVASLGSFAGTVVLTCDPPLPHGYACAIKPSSVSLPLGFNTLATYTLTPAYTASTQHSHAPRILLASLLPAGFLCLLGLTRKRRTLSRSGARNLARTLLALTLLTILATTTTACGPDHYIPITLGTYPVTFTGIGTNAATATTITHTVTVNVTITP